MSVEGNQPEARYELSVLIGPCSDADAEALMEEILNLKTCERVAGVVGSTRLRPDEDYAIPVPVAERLGELVARLERAEDRAVCSGCGQDVDESGACWTKACADAAVGEMIPASGLPGALLASCEKLAEVRAESAEIEAAAVARAETAERALREIGTTPAPLRGENTPAGTQCEYLKNLALTALAVAGQENQT